MVIIGVIITVYAALYIIAPRINRDSTLFPMLTVIAGFCGLALGAVVTGLAFYFLVGPDLSWPWLCGAVLAGLVSMGLGGQVAGMLFIERVAPGHIEEVLKKR